MKHLDVAYLKNGLEFLTLNGKPWVYIGVNPVSGRHIGVNAATGQVAQFLFDEMYEKPQEIVGYVLINKVDGVYSFGKTVQTEQLAQEIMDETAICVDWMKITKTI
jgi:hypothetical protein